MSLPKGVEKLPPGVKIHGNQILIDFRHGGKRYYKPLPNVARINKQSIMYAERKREVIRVEIKEGRFLWANHFPDSKEAQIEAGLSITKTTVVAMVEDWLEANELRLSTSTYSNYVKHSKRIKDFFKDREARDIVKNDILKFQKYLVGPKKKGDKVTGNRGLSIKTANETFIPLRGAMIDAYYSGQIRHNIFERVQNLKSSTSNIADPFEETELAAIEAKLKAYHRPQDILMILFNCWVGLSSSELMAVAWEDVDFVNKKIHIRRSQVDGEYKRPKNEYRQREIHLLDPAWNYLLQLKTHTYMQQPASIEVMGFDNIKAESEEVRLIFKNVTSQNELGAWDLSTLQRQYNYIYRKCGVRERGTNQTRHTFASRMITKLVPLEIVARLMGHNGTAMLKKHYAKIIKKEQPNTALIISKIIGIDYEEPTKLTKVV